MKKSKQHKSGAQDTHAHTQHAEHSKKYIARHTAAGHVRTCVHKRFTGT